MKRDNAKISFNDGRLLERLVNKYGKETLLNEMQDRGSILINDEEYSIIDPYDRLDTEDWDDSFAMIGCLRPGECMGFYNKTWCYRDMNGKVWQCYKDDMENCWRVQKYRNIEIKIEGLEMHLIPFLFMDVLLFVMQNPHREFQEHVEAHTLHRSIVA